MGWIAVAIGIATSLASCGAPGVVPVTPATPADAIDGGWSDPVTAFVGVRVFDGESVLENATVLVAGEEIVAVGRDIALPSSATVVDGTGRTLLPGLIDAHTHAWDPAQLETALVFGVTTMLDMMTPAEAASSFRADQSGEAGYVRADLYSAGYAATAPGGHGTEYGFPVPTLSAPGEAGHSSRSASPKGRTTSRSSTTTVRCTARIACRRSTRRRCVRSWRRRTPTAAWPWCIRVRSRARARRSARARTRWFTSGGTACRRRRSSTRCMPIRCS
jgi:hypothetical protein